MIIKTSAATTGRRVKNKLRRKEKPPRIKKPNKVKTAWSKISSSKENKPEIYNGPEDPSPVRQSRSLRNLFNREKKTEELKNQDGGYLSDDTTRASSESRKFSKPFLWGKSAGSLELEKNENQKAFPLDEESSTNKRHHFKRYLNNENKKSIQKNSNVQTDNNNSSVEKKGWRQRNPFHRNSSRSETQEPFFPEDGSARPFPSSETSDRPSRLRRWRNRAPESSRVSQTPLAEGEVDGPTRHRWRSRSQTSQRGDGETKGVRGRLWSRHRDENEKKNTEDSFSAVQNEKKRFWSRSLSDREIKKKENKNKNNEIINDDQNEKKRFWRRNKTIENNNNEKKNRFKKFIRSDKDGFQTLTDDELMKSTSNISNLQNNNLIMNPKNVSEETRKKNSWFRDRSENGQNEKRLRSWSSRRDNKEKEEKIENNNANNNETGKNKKERKRDKIKSFCNPKPSDVRDSSSKEKITENKTKKNKKIDNSKPPNEIPKDTKSILINQIKNSSEEERSSEPFRMLTDVWKANSRTSSLGESTPKNNNFESPQQTRTRSSGVEMQTRDMSHYYQTDELTDFQDASPSNGSFPSPIEYETDEEFIQKDKEVINLTPSDSYIDEENRKNSKHRHRHHKKSYGHRRQKSKSPFRYLKSSDIVTRKPEPSGSQVPLKSIFDILDGYGDENEFGRIDDNQNGSLINSPLLSSRPEVHYVEKMNLVAREMWLRV